MQRKTLKFDIVTIFPHILDSYINESLIARAQAKKFIQIKTHDLRKWSKGPHQQVDDRPFGGGLGMVLMVEPIYKAIKFIKSKAKKDKKTKVILFTPRGEKFTQKMANKLAKMDRVVFICGRYEGVDERVAEKIADTQVSLGEYDLMGGELPAMVCIEAISRLVPGVLGKPQLLAERVTKTGGFLEYAQYTRPEIFKVKTRLRDGRYSVASWRVPKLLLSGKHKEVQEWKDKHGKIIEE